MLLSQCINEAEKYDIDSGNPDSNYTNPYKDVLESVCYSDCNGNGICENGTKFLSYLIFYLRGFNFHYLLKSKNISIQFLSMCPFLKFHCPPLSPLNKSPMTK